MMDLFEELDKGAKANTYASGTPEVENIKKDRESKTDTKIDIISVSEYLDKLNSTLKNEKAKIIGEVSGLQEYPGRSYLYFSIKDKKDQSTVKCFMWKNDYKLSGVTLVDGVEIIVTAYPNIYKPNGGMTLQVEMIEMVGEGALQIAYEKLKAKLTLEGLFEESRKRIIPEFPRVIGVITSKSGAVIHDFNTNLGKCGFEILFVDSKVEGAGAVKDLLAALKTLSKKKVDVLVIMRGGGSLESFQAFNNESVVRAVSSFPASVLTGIGHDKDISLVSLVSDKNVSTPTAVANLLSLGFRDAVLKLRISEQNIYSLLENSIREKMFFLEQSERSIEKRFRTIFEKFDAYFHAIKHAEHRIESAIIRVRQDLSAISKNILALAGQGIIQMNNDLENMTKILEVRNPERQLRLGWSIARSRAGKIIRKVEDVKVGEGFEVMVTDGTIQSIRK